MPNDVKDAVKARSTGRRRLRARERRRQRLLRRRRGVRMAAAIRSRRTCTTPDRKAKSRRSPSRRRSAAAIRRRSPSLKPGETVLDLGSGGGIDVLLSARRVGPTGRAFGLDMTDEMLALAEENKRKSGLENVDVPQGRDRAHSAARQLGRRDHLELRHQPVRRQGSRAPRSVSRAQAGRPLRRLRRRRPRRGAGGHPEEHGAVDRLRRRRARRRRVRRPSSRRRASRASTSKTRASTASTMRERS